VRAACVAVLELWRVVRGGAVGWRRTSGAGRPAGWRVGGCDRGRGRRARGGAVGVSL